MLRFTVSTFIIELNSVTALMRMKLILILKKYITPVEAHFIFFNKGEQNSEIQWDYEQLCAENYTVYLSIWIIKSPFTRTLPSS